MKIEVPIRGVLALVALGIITVLPVDAGAVQSGVLKACVGPTSVDPHGVGVARRGDPITCSIEVVNVDPSAGSVCIKSVLDLFVGNPASCADQGCQCVGGTRDGLSCSGLAGDCPLSTGPNPGTCALLGRNTGIHDNLLDGANNEAGVDFRRCVTPAGAVGATPCTQQSDCGTGESCCVLLKTGFPSVSVDHLDGVKDSDSDPLNDKAVAYGTDMTSGLPFALRFPAQVDILSCEDTFPDWVPECGGDCPEPSTQVCAPAPGAQSCICHECGDGILCDFPGCTTGPGGGPEECDDGNKIDGDGCSSTCETESCEDTLAPQCAGPCPEPDVQVCFTTATGDACICHECGDGILCDFPGCTTGPGGGPEECDDGNKIDGDGCSSTCETGDDHYKCYKTRQIGGQFPQEIVHLEDQFVTTDPTVQRPLRFCNPVDKNDEGIGDPTAHLMCYKIKEPRFQQQTVAVTNQFGDQILAVRRPETLCVPAEKDRVPSDLNINHFKCYRVTKAKGAPKFTPAEVILKDQFETKTTIVVRPKVLCTPVDKNGEGIPDPAGHLTCFRIKDAPGQAQFEGESIDIDDQFADQALKPVRGDCREASMLCVPSTKQVLQ